MAILLFLRRNRNKLIVLLTPLLVLPLPIAWGSQEGKCAYGLILMAVFWTTEAVPLPVTAMLPVFMFPVMGVSKVNELAHLYYNHITFVFLGGLSVAITVEKWKIHRRFALRLLLLMGSEQKWLMLGFMLTTSFLSMWVSNTATTSMMIPIAQAVLVQLINTKKTVESKKSNIGDVESSKVVIEMDMNGVEILKERLTSDDTDTKEESEKLVESSDEEEQSFDFRKLDPDSQRLCKAFCLCICYAANCGGVGTLTGTGPNLVMKGQADLLADGNSGINFSSWFIFGFPIAFINVFICWSVLQISFFGWRSMTCKSKETDSSKAVEAVIQKEYKKLGEITFAEKAVFGHFIILVLAWFTLAPDFVPGWGSLFKKGYVNDAVPGVIIAFSLFVFPSRRRSSTDTAKEIPPLLDWKTFFQKIPWGVCVLLGGGFALARACTDSGLSKWLANQLSVFVNIPPWAMVIIVCIIVSLSTEMTSNTAICTIYMPILAELGRTRMRLPGTSYYGNMIDLPWAQGIHVNPIYIMLPAAVSTSFAFMLPVATPPNTIAFSYGYLKVIDMVKIGFILNFLCVLVVTLAINTWGNAYFKLDVYPDWATLKDDMISTASSNSNITDTRLFNTTTVSY